MLDTVATITVKLVQFEAEGTTKKNRIIQEFELGKLCSKYIIVKVPIKNFELFMNLNYISLN